MNIELENKYKEESGFDVGRHRIDNTDYYSGDYVEWIEKQLLLRNVSQQRELLRSYNLYLKNRYDFCENICDIDIDNFIGSEE